MIGAACRVSCATPMLGPAIGLLGISISAAAAGQTSRRTIRWYQGRGPHPLTWPPWEGAKRRDVALDAIGSLLLWRVLGGRFSSLMPSNVVRPGAFAKQSLPAKARPHGKHFLPQYGTSSELNMIQGFRLRDGCHHCGTRRAGPSIGDHIPPNVVAYGSGYRARLDALKMANTLNPKTRSALRKAMQLVGLKTPRPTRGAAHVERVRVSSWPKSALRGLLSKAGFRFGPPVQRLYPQCQGCSEVQSAAVRAGRRRLIPHYRSLRSYHATGLGIGLWQNVPAARPGGLGFMGSSDSQPAAPWRPFQGYDTSGNATLASPPGELRQRLRDVGRKEAGIAQQRANRTSEEPAASMQLLALKGQRVHLEILLMLKE